MKINNKVFLLTLVFGICSTITLHGQSCSIGCSNIANGNFEQKNLYGYATYHGDNQFGGLPFMYNQVKCWHEFVESPHIWPVDSSSLLFNHFTVMAFYASISNGQISEGSEVPGIYSTNFCLDSSSQYKVRFDWAAFNCDSLTNYQGNLAFCFTNDTLFSLSAPNSTDIISSFGGVNPDLGITYDNYQNPPMFYSANWHHSQTLEPFLYENQERFIVTSFIDSLSDGTYKSLIFIDNIEFIPYIEFKIDTICAETSHYKVYPINLNPKYQIQFESSWSTNVANFATSNDTCEFDLISYNPGSPSDIKISYFIQDTACNSTPCMVSDTLFSILYPYVPLQVAFSFIEDISCSPFCDGKISASLIGGSGNGSYTWGNGITASLNNQACLGFNDVTIIDQFGCQITDSVELQEIPFDAEIVTYSESKCGACDAVIGVNFISGEGPYTYAWNNQITTNINDQACVGINIVIITDNDGCTIEESIQVYDSIQPSFSEVVVEGCVCDSNSQAFAYVPDSNIFNGILPYEFYWFTNPYQDQDTAYFDSPGIYDVEFYSGGCVFSKSFNISCYQITPQKVTKATCKDVCDGSISGWGIESDCVSPIDLNSLTYIWSFGDTMNYSQPIGNLCAGIYFVTIIDGNGYFGIDTLIIEASNSPILSISTSSPSCSNLCDGEIETTLSNFSAYPVTFNLYQSTSPQTIISTASQTAMFFNLCSDSIYITAIDFNGCFADYHGFLVAEPFYNVDSLQSNNCQSNDTIAVNLTTYGLYGPFSYIWSSGELTQDIIAPAPGTYYVTTTDANNCTIIDTFSFNNDQMLVNIDFTEQTCSQIANGSIDLYIDGGQAPYSYHWNTGESTQNLQNLGIGHFFVTITDSYNCQIDTQLFLSDSLYLVTDYQITPVTCQDTAGIVYLGSIDLSIQGGIEPYQVIWNNSSTSVSIDSLQAGFYCVTVSDSIGCVNVLQLNVPAGKLQIHFTDRGNGCDSLPNGTVTPILYGGIPPYSYVWNNFSTGSTLGNLIDSVYYSVTITDINGCAGEDSVLLMSEQVIDLINGWSYWSTYIDLENPHYLIDNYFHANGLDTSIIIMKNDLGIVYWPSYGLNDIGYFKNGEGYQIKVPVTGTYSFTARGRLICPERFEMEIHDGTNFIAYLRTTESLIQDELGSISNDILYVNNTAGSSYIPQYNINQIGYMIPGQGYKLMPNNLTSFYYSQNNPNVGTKIMFDEFPMPDNSDIRTDNSMVLIIPLASWTVMPNLYDLIIVKGQNGQIVGRGYFNGNNSAICLYGDDSSTPNETEGLAEGEPFILEIWNPNQEKNMTANVSLLTWERGDGNFYKNELAVIAIPDESVISSIGDWIEMQIAPNPNKGSFNVLTISSYEGPAKISIFNADGVLIVHDIIVNMNIGNNSFPIDIQNLPVGNYILEISFGMKKNGSNFTILN